MPLYPYRCTQCGHRFEKIQKFSDEPEHECPKCHGPLERPLTAPGLSFKGAGWYVNDYASKSSSSKSDSAAPETKSSDTKSSDTKSSATSSSESKTSLPAAPAATSAAN